MPAQTHVLKLAGQMTAPEPPPILSPQPPPIPGTVGVDADAGAATLALPSAEGRLKWLLRPIRLERCRSARQFIGRILVQQFLAKVALSIPVGILFQDDSNAQAELLRTPLVAFVAMVLVAPPLETLLLQAAPIELLRAFRRSRAWQFLFGAVPFALLHFPQGIGVGVGAGVVGGLFFSYTYLEGRNRSAWSALWITTVTHALHNLIVLPLALLMVN